MPSTKNKSKPKSKTPATDPGEVALRQLEKRLSAIPAERVTQPRSDVRAAASFVLSDTCKRLSTPKLRTRLRSLPAAEFDQAAVDDLATAAQAALWVQSQLAAEEAQQPGTLLDVKLIEEATELRGRMLKVLEYNLDDRGDVMKEAADIRAGQGYLDLAEDLRRLAVLYRRHQPELAADRRRYRATDAGTAVALSQRIQSELRRRGAAAARDLSWRAWALLLELYDEAAAAARFLLRHEDGDTKFPSLNTMGRSERRRAKKPDPGPASPPATP